VTIPNIAPSWLSEWRPLSSTQTEPRIQPRLLIYHTMVGGLKGTENYFKNINGAGYSGPESTWGVGGKWDGNLDGVAWQWQGLLFQADANFDPANNYANSVETSDGGIYPTPEWSPKEMAKLIQIGTWWCHAVGQEPVIAKSYDGHGLGFHQLFREWNKGGHNCPGPLRRAQFYDVLVPGIQKAYNSRGDDSMSAADVAALKAYFDTKIDDIAALAAQKVWERRLGSAWDGQSQSAERALLSAQRYAIEAGWAGDRPPGNGNPGTPTFAKTVKDLLEGPPQ
jgi:hypothetical protein